MPRHDRARVQLLDRVKRPEPGTAALAATVGEVEVHALSGIARDGTTKDARKIGRNLFSPHRKATTWPSAASKAAVRLEYRP